MFSRSPLLVVGLDGAGFALLDRLMADGYLPTLRRLQQTGSRAVLQSTLPVATLPAWTSFLTGYEPAQHGVTDLLATDRQGGLQPMSGAWRTVPTVLRRASLAGLQVACLGMPGTYPPEPVSGVCVAGFDTPDARLAGRRSVWPPSLARALSRDGGWRYGAFNEHGSARHRLQRAAAALQADIAVKERIALRLWRAQPWDLFCIHLQASDTAAHHLWHTYDRTSPRFAPGHEELLPAIYARLDGFIARLCDAAGANVRVMVVSDHGMGPADDVAVHLNRLLAQLGLLRFAPQSWSRRSAKRAASHALRYLPKSTSQALIHLAPPAWLRRLVALSRGNGFAPAASAAFSQELDYAPAIWRTDPTVALEPVVAALLALRHPDSQEPLVAKVWRRDELPQGPHADRQPDLLLEPAWPNGARASFLPSVGPGPVVRRLQPEELHGAKGAGMPGVHHRDGVFVLAGPGIPVGNLPPFGIAAGGTLLHALLSLPPPAGAVAPPAYAMQHLGLTQEPAPPPEIPRPWRTPPPALLQRLTSLGYL